MTVISVHQLEQQLALWGEFAPLTAVGGCECCRRLHVDDSKPTKIQSASRANNKCLKIRNDPNMAQNGSPKGFCA